MNDGKTYIEDKDEHGEIIYKCLICGAVGNWKEEITTGRCHNK